jgi:hypothetical protein
MYLVWANTEATWLVNREQADVKVGDLVGFNDFRDAELFCSSDRAIPLTEDEVAKLEAGEELTPPVGKTAPKPKAKRATKAKSDVQEDS